MQSSVYIGEFPTIQSPNGNIYKAIGLNGSGSFGKVYQVVTQHNQTYAMKMIDMMQIQDSKQIEYVITEQEIMRCVNSPHILKIHDQFLHKNEYVLIVDQCDGGDLCYHLNNRYKNGMPEELALSVLCQVFRGLAMLYQYKIIHRDLKLSNLMFHKGKVVIGDFGLAKIGGNAQSHVGSLPYMAPEILYNSGLTGSSVLSYTSQVDVWSCGVCFYFLLFGRLPFDGKSPKVLLENISRYSGERLPLPRTDIQEKTKGLLRLMLQIDPLERITFPTLFGLFEVDFREPFDSSDPFMMEIERSVFLKPTVPSQIDHGDDFSLSTSNSHSNAELKIIHENTSTSKSAEINAVYLDTFIGLSDQNKELVLQNTLIINKILFFMNCAKEIIRLLSEPSPALTKFATEAQNIDFILFYKSSLFLHQIRNMLEGKPNFLATEFPFHLFTKEALERYDMVLLGLYNKQTHFFTTKRVNVGGRNTLDPTLVPLTKLSLDEIDELLKSKVKTFWFGFLEAETRLPYEATKIVLKIIYLLMHAVGFQEFFGKGFKMKPSMFTNFHKDLRNKSVMQLKCWIQLAFVIHKLRFNFFQ